MNEVITRDDLLKELTAILEENSEIQKTIVRISQKKFADKEQTEDRFDRMLKELKKDREENSRKWEENNKKLDEMMRKSDERFAAMLQEIKDIRSRQESSVGALGARWGIAAESSFRSALKGILEDRFDVQVVNVTEYDKEGSVFGHPDQVEIDVIIKNGEIIVCEIKSSMSRSDMYTFHRKVQFYEKQHGCKVTTVMVISPMVDKKAVSVAEKLGIVVYSYAENAELI
ncbi:MAG: hypothetical protein BWK80_12855 [Desulfobacteraceae bacterium IS3]|nr:MAG: hypothetical protein BWK80_12855 [Desulfobacteraceae bacterium IS3]